MEQFILTNADKGYQRSFRELEAIQNNFINGFKAVVRSLIGDSVPVSDIIILNGCTIDVDGQDYTLSAGLAYYNDEIYEVDAKVFTAAGGEIGVWALDTTTIQLNFADGSAYDAREVRKLTLQSGLSGSGLKDHGDTSTLINYVTLAAQSAIVDGAPGVLDTLNEIAAALGDDENFATTVTNALAGKLSLSGGTMGGNIAMGSNKITGLDTATASGDAVEFDQFDDAISDRPLKNKTIEIGDWDMDANISVTVALPAGVSLADIRSVTGIIRNDADNLFLSLGHYNVSTQTVDVAIDNISSGGIQLARKTGGYFDGTLFDSTSFNRGWLTIQHV